MSTQRLGTQSNRAEEDLVLDELAPRRDSSRSFSRDRNGAQVWGRHRFYPAANIRAVPPKNTHARKWFQGPFSACVLCEQFLAGQPGCWLAYCYQRSFSLTEYFLITETRKKSLRGGAPGKTVRTERRKRRLEREAIRPYFP